MTLEKTYTVGGLTAEQWRERVRYDEATGRLIFQPGMKFEGKPAGTWHKRKLCWILLCNQRNYSQKAIKHLMLRGFVPADMRRFPIVNTGPDRRVEKIEDLKILPRREALDLARVRRIEKRKADYKGEPEKPAQGAEIAPNGYPTAMDTVEQAAEKMLAMSKSRRSSTLRC